MKVVSLHCTTPISIPEFSMHYALSSTPPPMTVIISSLGLHWFNDLPVSFAHVKGNYYELVWDMRQTPPLLIGPAPVSCRGVAISPASLNGDEQGRTSNPLTRVPAKNSGMPWRKLGKPLLSQRTIRSHRTHFT
jgi:hypothetical protein